MSLIIKRLFKKLLHIYTLKCKYFDIIIYFRLDILFYSILYLPFDKLFYEHVLDRLCCYITNVLLYFLIIF